jgi:hypothetical protein
MRLRRPHEQLAHCVWLPRLIDKARLHLAGQLPPDYARAFCNPLGVDGLFLAHFGLKADEVLAAVGRASSDAEIAVWFAGQPQVTAERIQDWNALAPRIGEPGQPGEKGFRWARQHFYAACTDPRVTNAFTAIAWDEGFLDELSPP